MDTTGILFDKETRDRICKAFYEADKLTVSMFEGKNIHENTITLKLTENIYNEVLKISSESVHLYSEPNNQEFERLTGTDACIVLKDLDKDIAKICLFEAKKVKRKWDQYDYEVDDIKKVKVSHFSKQLKLQSIINEKPYAIWEHFYFNDRQSHCIWHSDAYSYLNNNVLNRLWSNQDIINLRTYNKVNSLAMTIRKVMLCEKGKLLKLIDVGPIIEGIKPKAWIDIEISKGEINQDIIELGNPPSDSGNIKKINISLSNNISYN